MNKKTQELILSLQAELKVKNEFINQMAVNRHNLEQKVITIEHQIAELDQRLERAERMAGLVV